MAVQPSKQPRNVQQTFSPLPAVKGAPTPHLPMFPIQTGTPPVEQTSTTVASDSVAFTVKPHQTITVTFPNLPSRAPLQNPLGLRQVVSDIAVRPLDQLHFSVSLQGVTGAQPTVKPLAVDTSNVRTPGPFLGGGNAYRTFQATITAGSTGASGTAVASLVYLTS